MATSPAFEFTIDGEVDDRLLVGTASPGMASLVTVGVLVTPAHPLGPDFEGALRLLDAVRQHSGATVDTTLLEQRSEEVQQYDAELASRIEAAESERDPLDDRMYV